MKTRWEATQMASDTERYVANNTQPLHIKRRVLLQAANEIRTLEGISGLNEYIDMGECSPVYDTDGDPVDWEEFARLSAQASKAVSDGDKRFGMLACAFLCCAANNYADAAWFVVMAAYYSCWMDERGMDADVWQIEYAQSAIMEHLN